VLNIFQADYYSRGPTAELRFNDLSRVSRGISQFESKNVLDLHFQSKRRRVQTQPERLWSRNIIWQLTWPTAHFWQMLFRGGQS
jgi:hypothetical protein